MDHFFPHDLKKVGFAVIDGIWNLVLTCRECNRGSGGKFNSISTERLLERLHKRNEFYIYSYHPLRETLIQQTGESTKQRIAFLNDFWNRARSMRIITWEPQEKSEPAF